MVKQVVENIRKGEIDINNIDPFFSTLIKGLLSKLDNDIKIRNNPVPHFILSTGDDTMYLNAKGYDYSKDLHEISNESGIYNIIPRCIVNPGGISLQPDQLSSPYSFGSLQYENETGMYSLCGEFRRIPMTLSCDIKYYLDSYKDLLDITQQIISKLSFVRTFNFVYMGQTIKCSYQIPTDLEGETNIEMDGTTTDGKTKTLSLSLTIETTYPIWAEKTIMSKDKLIVNIEQDNHIKPVKTNGLI